MSGDGDDPGEPPPSERPPSERPPSDRPPDALRRLDPDLAVGARPPLAPHAPGAARPPDRSREPGIAVDTRRYRWMLGIFGLVVVAIVSVYQFAANGVASTGVPPGQRLHWFAAPLANTTLVGDADLRPPCTVARHDPRALNICLIASQRPLVLSFFVIGSSECEHQVDALQVLSRRYPAIQFAAVAIKAGRADTMGLIRSHRWTIPVAYDRDGAVGSLYGVTICPMAELADRGGVVRDRLIGTPWQTVAAIEPRVAALARAAGR